MCITTTRSAQKEITSSKRIAEAAPVVSRSALIAHALLDKANKGLGFTGLAPGERLSPSAVPWAHSLFGMLQYRRRFITLIPCCITTLNVRNPSAFPPWKRAVENAKRCPSPPWEDLKVSTPFFQQIHNLRYPLIQALNSQKPNKRLT